MKPIKFKINCNYKGKRYISGSILEDIKEEDLESIWKLNEKGFIEPLSVKEFKKIQNKVTKSQREE